LSARIQETPATFVEEVLPEEDVEAIVTLARIGTTLKDLTEVPQGKTE